MADAAFVLWYHWLEDGYNEAIKWLPCV